jgi:hypothetical protein
MPDIITARAPIATAPPALTSHLRHHLKAQYRADLRHDEAELGRLSSAARHGPADKRRTHRIGQLYLRIAATQEAIAEIDGGAA